MAHRWGKPTKRKQRIDPRYFLEETVNRLDEELTPEKIIQIYKKEFAFHEGGMQPMHGQRPFYDSFEDVESAAQMDTLKTLGLDPESPEAAKVLNILRRG
jgi:hypothetical protein